MLIVSSIGLSFAGCNDQAKGKKPLSIYPTQAETSQDETHTTKPVSLKAKYNIGDCFYFKTIDSGYAAIIISDIHIDTVQIWYGGYFTSYHFKKIPTIQRLREGKVMGRKVTSGLHEQGYVKCLDGEFLLDTLLSNLGYFKLLGNIRKQDEIKLGAYGASTTISEFRMAFQKRAEARQQLPDDYTEFWKKHDSFHPDEYFLMKDIMK